MKNFLLNSLSFLLAALALAAFGYYVLFEVLLKPGAFGG